MPVKSGDPNRLTATTTRIKYNKDKKFKQLQSVDELVLLHQTQHECSSCFSLYSHILIFSSSSNKMYIYLIIDCGMFLFYLVFFYIRFFFLHFCYSLFWKKKFEIFYRTFFFGIFFYIDLFNFPFVWTKTFFYHFSRIVPVYLYFVAGWS